LNFISPGLGLGAILAKPKAITDRQIYISASALATSLTEEERSLELLYPVVSRIRHVSAQVAAAVIVETVDEGLARDKQIIKMVQNNIKALKTRKGKEWDNLVKFVQESMWDPDSEKFFNIEELLGKSKM
jgi:malic enzyme